MATTINERIKEVLNTVYQGNISAMAKSTGIKRTTLNSVVGASEVTPGYDMLQKIGDISSHKISMEWLIRGTGTMFAPSTPAEELRPRIPLTAMAGRLPDITSPVTLADCEMLPVVKLLPPYQCTIIIQGDSMEPKFEGGDEIALRQVMDYIEWGKTYVLDTADGVVLKRLYDDGDSFRCVSYNPDYPPFTIEKQNVYRIFKVVGLIRRYH